MGRSGRGKIRIPTVDLPFTATIVGLMVGFGILTGSFWGHLQNTIWWGRFAYGLPAFEDGRWWTPVTGSVLALDIWEYIPVLLGFAIMVGLTERRFGTRVAMTCALGGQLFAVLAAASLLAVLRHSGWSWAAERARDLDVGFSAGALTALIVFAVSVRPPWRLRLIASILTYCIVSLALFGELWDIEHLLAALLGLVVAPRIVRRSDPAVR